MMLKNTCINWLPSPRTPGKHGFQLQLDTRLAGAQIQRAQLHGIGHHRIDIQQRALRRAPAAQNSINCPPEFWCAAPDRGFCRPCSAPFPASVGSSASRSENPRIAVSGLLISCAAPAANWPRDTSFSDCTICACSRCRFSMDCSRLRQQPRRDPRPPNACAEIPAKRAARRPSTWSSAENRATRAVVLEAQSVNRKQRQTKSPPPSPVARPTRFRRGSSSPSVLDTVSVGASSPGAVR